MASVPNVTLVDNGSFWTLDNGIVKATINKNNGVLTSLVYNGFNTGSRGVWEHTPQGAPRLTNSVTIDPTANHGERAEVSIKGVGGGTFVFTAGAPGGGTTCDVELRYSLGRGDHGIYTYSIFRHPASYPAASTGAEDRFIDSLDQSFDWITVDKDRNMLEAKPDDWGTGVVVHAKEQRIMDKGVYKNSVEHKYSYSGEQYHTPAYGWSGTQTHYGVWFINPTVEYLSGGATRLDLDAHLGANNNPPPIILDYWHSGHYTGGTRANIAAGEEWSKVIGPIFVYVNHLDHPKATSQAELDTLKATEGDPTVPSSWRNNANSLWADALAQARKERSKWPYDWVKGCDYTPLAQRGTVNGRIVLNDPMAPKGSSKKLPHLTVILSHPDEPLRELPPVHLLPNVVARLEREGSILVPSVHTRREAPEAGFMTPASISSSPTGRKTEGSLSRRFALANIRCTPMLTVFWVSSKKPMSRLSREDRSISVSSSGDRYGLENSYGKSERQTAAPANF